MNHLIKLYLNPPKHLYCFDECRGIQVLQRLSPDLQTEEMKMRLEEFEYIPNGTIDMIAFYSVNTGKCMQSVLEITRKKLLLRCLKGI